MSKKDYYDLLGIDRNASEKQIKSAYHKLAVKWHPDKWVGKSEKEKKLAEENFKEINEAYTTLSNPEKRQNYDRYGSAEGFAQGSPGDDFGREGSFFQDIFETFFGDRTDYSGQTKYSEDKTRPRAGTDILIKVDLSFKESILGVEKKKIALELEKACGACQQTGAASRNDVVECPTCQGYGVVNTIKKTIFGGAIRTQTTCPRCQGEKQIIKKKCRQCGGRKFVTEKETIEIKIPRGIQPEERLHYEKIGNEGWYGGGRGDIYVATRVKENPYFQRKGNDIHVKLPVSFLDAILGNTVEVITLEKVEKISIPAGTQNGDHLILRNRGCYLGINKATRGNFYVWLQIKLPKKITPATETIFRNIQRETSWNPNRDFIEKNKDIVDK